MVYDGRLEEQRLMNQGHADKLDTRIVEKAEEVNGEASAASDERARLWKEEVRQEAHEESRAIWQHSPTL